MLELRLYVPEVVGALHAPEDGVTNVQDERFRETLGRLPGVTKVEQLAGQAREDGQPETLVFQLYASADVGTLLASAAQAVIQEQSELLDLRFTRPSLEDVFISLPAVPSIPGLRSARLNGFKS